MSNGIEIYSGPLNATGGVIEDYRSNLYSVSAWTGTQFSAIYLYSSTASAYTNTGVSGDRNQFWVKGSYPVVSFATFGTSGTTSAAISRIGGSVTSIDIGPKSKNTEWSISNGIAYVKMNQKDKLFININNTPSSPLCLFADPLKPSIPNTGSYIYFSSVSSIGVNFSSFPSDTTIYLDGGAYVKGTFNVSGKNNIRIMGPGILAGDDYYETAIAEKRAITNGNYDEINKYIPIRGSLNYDDIQANWPSGVGVSGITILKTMFYAAKYINFVDGVKLVSPWEFNTDGLYIFPDKSTSTCGHKNCFLFNVDDAIFLNKNNSQGFNNPRGTMLFENNYIVSHNNGPIVLAYQAEYYGDFLGSKDRGASCINTDFLFFGPLINNGVNSIVKLYLGNTDPGASGTPVNWGYFNALVSGLRSDNTIEVPLIKLSNYCDPFVLKDGGFRPPAGVGSGITIADVDVSMTQAAISGNFVSGFSSDPASGIEIRDVTFKNLKINGVKVDRFNYRNYFNFSEASDPILHPEKNINFLTQIYEGIKAKVSGAWKNCIAWIKTSSGWKIVNNFVKNNDDWNAFTTPGLELYSPQTESLRSSLYQVQVQNDPIYLNSYVYSSTAKFGEGGVSGARAVFHYDPGSASYKNRLWSLNDKPIISFTTFGSSSTRKVKVSANSNITSYTIRPKSKNFNPSVSSGSLYLDMSPKDKAWITINNDVSNTLFVFCDPLKPQVPSNNTLYFGPGVHHLSALAGAQVINASSNYSATPGDGLQRIETFYGASYSALQNYGYTEGQPFTIYLDGGSYVIGQFDFRGKNNIKVVGPGILAGDNIVEQCTRYVDDNFHTRLEPYGILSQLRGVTYAYQEQGLNTYDRVPSGLVVSGPTVINSHFINFPGMNVVDNVKLISPFMPNTDIKAPMPDGATSAAIMRDCMIFLGDDAIIPTPYNAYPTEPNTGYLNIGGQFDISGCQVYTVNGGPLVIPYFGVLYPSSTPRAYPIKVYDMDFGIYTLDEGGGGRNGVPIDSENGEVAIRITMDMSSIYSGAWDNGLFKYGINNVTVSNIRFDDPIDQALIWVGNVPDPYFPTPVSFRGDEHGSLSGISFIDISVSSHPGYTDQIRSNLLFSKNATNRPKDITFKNISIDGVTLTNANYTTYFQVSGIDSDPPNLGTDNINFTT